MITRTSFDIEWTWEHRIDVPGRDQPLRLGEIEVMVCVNCEAEYPVVEGDISFTIDAVAAMHRVLVEPNMWKARRVYEWLSVWLPHDDDLVCLIRKDLERCERFGQAVRERAMEQAMETV